MDFFLEIGGGDAVHELGFADAEVTAQGDDVAGAESCAELSSEIDGLSESLCFHRCEVMGKR